MFNNYKKFKSGGIHSNVYCDFDENIRIFMDKNRTELGGVNSFAYKTYIKANFEKMISEGVIKLVFFSFFILLVNKFVLTSASSFSETLGLLINSFDFIITNFHPLILWILGGVFVYPFLRVINAYFPSSIQMKNLQEIEKTLMHVKTKKAVKGNLDILKGTFGINKKAEELRNKLIKKCEINFKGEYLV